MPTLLKCAAGHEWQAATSGLAVDGPSRCPVCGASAVSPTKASLVSEKPTLPPRSASLESATPSEIPPFVPADAAVTADDWPRLPGFDMLAELGRGGMGVVYKANQSRLDRLVAIKILPAQAGRDSAFAERFTREAKSLARLNHASIITIYDFGQAGEQSYFVMEFVEGENLRQRLRSGRLPPPEVYRLVGQICDGLEYAHERGIVHRDIKPENILLDERGRVKIADFGIAKLLTGEARKDYTLTGPMQMVGTFHYMAPEQIDNPLGLDHRADIYSLGVMMYEMLTGQRPVGRFEPPSHLAPVDARVDTIVLKALEREPARRFGSAAELQAALATLSGSASAPLASHNVPTAPISGPVRADTSPTAPVHLGAPPAKADVNPVWQNVQWLAAGILLLGMLLLFGGIYVLPASDGGPVNLRVTLFLVATFIAVALFLVAQVATSGSQVVRRLLGSAGGWAVVVSLLGVVVCVLPQVPWAQVKLVVSDRGHTNIVGEVYGYEGGFGLWPAAIFAAVFWVFVLSGEKQLMRWWQPAVVLTAAAGILLILFNCLSGGQVPMSLTMDKGEAPQAPGPYYLAVFPRFGGAQRFVMKVRSVTAKEPPLWTDPVWIDIGRRAPGPGTDMLPGVQNVTLRNDPDNKLLRERLIKGESPTVQTPPGPGLWATMVMAMGLVLVGMMQVRGVIQQRKRSGASRFPE